MRTEFVEKTHRPEKRSFNFADLLYLRADCKYVEAHHAGGLLVLDDSLVALEREFGDRLLRIHRAILVARDKPMMIVTADGAHFIKLAGVGAALPISRRYVNRVRRALEAA